MPRLICKKTTRKGVRIKIAGRISGRDAAGEAGGIGQGQGLGDDFSQELEGGDHDQEHQPFAPGAPEAQNHGGGQDRKDDAGGLHPDEHRRQQTPGPGQDGLHHPSPGRVLLFKAQTIQGAQGKEGGFGHGEEGHQEHQDAHGQPADEIGI